MAIKQERHVTKMAYAESYTPAWINAPLAGTVSDEERQNGHYWKNLIGIPEIEMMPIMINVPPKFNGGRPVSKKVGKIVDDKFVNTAFLPVRADTLQPVSDQTRSGLYRPFNYLDGFNVFTSVSDVYDLNVLTSGDIDDGAGWWISAEMPGYVVADELIKRTLFGMTMNDGSSPIRYAGIGTVPICDNTLAMAIQQAKASDTRTSLRHVATSDEIMAERVEQLIVAIKASLGFFDTYKKEMEFLAGFPATEAIANDLFDSVIFPMPEIKRNDAPMFVAPDGSDLTIPQTVKSEKEPIQIVRRNEARDDWSSIVTQEFEHRGATLQAVAHAATGFYQYADRMSNSKTPMMQKRMLANTFGKANDGKRNAIDALLTLASK